MEKLKKAIAIINQYGDQADFEDGKEERLIALAEQKLNLKFPDSYRLFLKELGCGDIAGQEFYGIINEDFDNSGVPDAIWLTMVERQESNLPLNYVIIGSTGDGDYFVLDCSNNGKTNVLLWAPGLEDHPSAFEPYCDDYSDFLYDRIVTILE